MKKYWVMKTFQSWWTTFQSKNIIGIDEDGIDSDYLALSRSDVDAILKDTSNNCKDFQNRVFQEFCKWMQVDDLVIIGTGQTTTFNISGIVRVKSSYYFDANLEPRHIRDVEILKVFNPPLPMLRFSRTPRLEMIDEADFHEAVISLL